MEYSVMLSTTRRSRSSLSREAASARRVSETSTRTKTVDCTAPAASLIAEAVRLVQVAAPFFASNGATI